MVHSQLCPKVSCNCPKRLAAGTVVSLLGKRLRLTLKSTLKLFSRNRQARLLISSEAVPMLFVKFSTLIHFLRHSIRRSSHLSLVNDYILARDTVFFVVYFCH